MPQQKPQLNPEKLAATVRHIGETIYRLRFGAGFNMKAVVILLARETKLSEGTIRKVLDGLNDLHKHYFEQEQ